jgi:hypothetical protein
MDKNSDSQPLIQPYSYTTPHNIHSSAIYNQYTTITKLNNPTVGHPKWRNEHTLNREWLTKSCLKSSVLLNPLIGHLQTWILRVPAGQSQQACPTDSSACSYNTKISCREYEILTSRHNQFLNTHKEWPPWSRLGVNVLNHNTIHRNQVCLAMSYIICGINHQTTAC